MPLPEFSSAADVASQIVGNAPDTLNPKAKNLFRTLVWIALETSRRRGESPQTTEVVFHCPLEQLAAAAKISRVSAWRHLPALQELGLVDFRTHKASCRGETRSSGTVWRVRLTARRGSKARVSADDMRHKWRDLDKDVRAGRTSYTALKHTKNLKDTSLIFEQLLMWTLPRVTKQNPVTPVCFKSSEAVLDVAFAAREQRGAAVDDAAKALAAALRDASSVNWYRKLLWQLLRRIDLTGEDYSYQVYLVAQRAKTDVSEGFAKRGGALFQSRLKGAAWFDPVMNAPPTRVGLKPIG